MPLKYGGNTFEKRWGMMEIVCRFVEDQVAGRTGLQIRRMFMPVFLSWVKFKTQTAHDISRGTKS